VARLLSSYKPYESWKYEASLSHDSLSARVDVHDHLPERFAEYFEGLALDWKGWSGSREYESLEPMLKLSAAHNGVGAVRFMIVLRAGANVDLRVGGASTSDGSCRLDSYWLLAH